MSLEDYAPVERPILSHTELLIEKMKNAGLAGVVNKLGAIMAIQDKLANLDPWQDSAEYDKLTRERNEITEGILSNPEEIDPLVQWFRTTTDLDRNDVMQTLFDVADIDAMKLISGGRDVLDQKYARYK